MLTLVAELVCICSLGWQSHQYLPFSVFVFLTQHRAVHATTRIACSCHTRIDALPMLHRSRSPSCVRTASWQPIDMKGSMATRKAAHTQRPTSATAIWTARLPQRAPPCHGRPLAMSQGSGAGAGRGPSLLRTGGPSAPTARTCSRSSTNSAHYGGCLRHHVTRGLIWTRHWNFADSMPMMVVRHVVFCRCRGNDCGASVLIMSVAGSSSWLWATTRTTLAPWLTTTPMWQGTSPSMTFRTLW